jgi:hypothetical protein
MSQGTCSGLPGRNKPIIGEIMLELIIWAKRCVSKTLLETIPTYLAITLETYILRVGHWRDWRHMSPSKEVIVYDILSAGPRSRFTVLTREGPKVVSNCIQRSAHDIHQKSIELVEQVSTEQGFTMMWSPKAVESGRLIRPWIVDLHDESMWAVPDEHVKAFEDIIIDADARLNMWLGGHITMSGDPEVAQTLAGFKVED